MRLASHPEPFDHVDWVYKLKYDGFRALAQVSENGLQLISRNRNTYKSFGRLCHALRTDLCGRTALLDGEIVYLDADGRPQFYDLLRRRDPAYYYAFDRLELDGEDLRPLPLIERKERLRSIVHPSCSRLLYAGHIDRRGAQLYGEVCRRDLEGIVAKWKYSSYVHGDEQPEDRRLVRHAHNPGSAMRLTWIKIKNPNYSQMAGRDQLFKARAAAG